MKLLKFSVPCLSWSLSRFRVLRAKAGVLVTWYLKFYAWNCWGLSERCCLEAIAPPASHDSLNQCINGFVWGRRATERSSGARWLSSCKRRIWLGFGQECYIADIFTLWCGKLLGLVSCCFLLGLISIRPKCYTFVYQRYSPVLWTILRYAHHLDFEISVGMKQMQAQKD